MTEIIDRTIESDRKTYNRVAGYKIQYSVNSDGHFIIRIYNPVSLRDKDILFILDTIDTKRLIKFCQAIEEVVL